MASNSDVCKKVIKFISNRIGTYSHPENLVKWCELAKKTINYDKSPQAFSSTITYRLDRIEDLEGLSLMEKVRLVFLFSRRVSAEFVEELQDENCVVELNDNGKIKYFRSPGGTCVLKADHSKTQKYFKGKPDYDKKKAAAKPARKSQNVRKPKPVPIPQVIPNQPEVDDVEMGHEEEEEAPEQKPEDLNGLRDQHNNPVQNFAQNLKSEEDEDLINGSLHPGTPFNGRIDYSDLDNGEHPEFMVPVGYQPPNQSNKRRPELSQEKAKRPKIERQEEPEIGNPPETNEVEMRKPEESDGLRPTRSNDLNIQDQDAQARAHDNNEAQNSGQNSQNRVNMEDFVEEIQQAPEVLIPDEKPQLRPLVLETICLRKLAVQIEALAFNINLDDSFQQKALKAVRLFKANNQLISIQDFNQLFKIVLKNLKSGRLQNPTGSSIQLCRLFKHLERSLIRPLGEFLMADTLKLLETEISKLEGSKDEIPLKAVQGKLDGLMLVITNSWADLDE